MVMHRYRIKPRSGFATPLRSDTLYGHLLWAAALVDGEARVTELIEAFAGGLPPFVLSSALPKGQLPMPPLPGIPRARFKEQFGGKGNLLAQLQRYKAFRKAGYWPMQHWQTHQGKISQEVLFSAWLVEKAAKAKSGQQGPADEPMISAYQTHVSIDRASGGVIAQGGLFFSRGTWYWPGTELDLYVRTDDRKAFETLFDHVRDVGFGADRSTGMGQFDYTLDEKFEGSLFDVDGTHRLSLSVCACPDLTGFDGYWLSMIKHGRAWSGFGQTNPYKKPFFGFAEGSLFSRMPDAGYLLRNIHSDPKIVQIGWPLTIPVTLEDDHAD
jgi:CRISPR-associated protein Csm4